MEDCAQGTGIETGIKQIFEQRSVSCEVFWLIFIMESDFSGAKNY